MQIETSRRHFSYLGLELPDLDVKMTPEQIRDAYCSLYPEITTASIEGPEVVDGVLKFKFTRAWGPKDDPSGSHQGAGSVRSRSQPGTTGGEVHTDVPNRADCRNCWAAVLGLKGYSRHNRSDGSLPVPPGLVHPG